LSELPHHNPAPRWVALSLALGIVLVGVWAGTKPVQQSRAHTVERTRLVNRREKLFGELARLEHERKQGRPDDGRYGSRREEILAALEQVYGALDADGAPSDAASAAGVAR
jgi:hypothetical protein